MADEKGIYLLGLNTAALGTDLKAMHKGETKIIKVEFDFPFLRAGTYSFSPAVAEGELDDYEQQHWVHDAYILKISSPDPSARLGHYFALKSNVSIEVH